VLNAVDLSRTEPKITFHEVSGTRSMDLIETLRSPGHQRGSAKVEL
jgi:hypothetical protein